MNESVKFSRRDPNHRVGPTIQSQHLAENRFVDGLESGIGMIGEKLRKHFPYRSDDVNELPDDISYGDGAGQ